MAIILAISSVRSGQMCHSACVWQHQLCKTLVIWQSILMVSHIVTTVPSMLAPFAVGVFYRGPCLCQAKLLPSSLGRKIAYFLETSMWHITDTLKTAFRVTIALVWMTMYIWNCQSSHLQMLSLTLFMMVNDLCHHCNANGSCQLPDTLRKKRKMEKQLPQIVDLS